MAEPPENVCHCRGNYGNKNKVSKEMTLEKAAWFSSAANSMEQYNNGWFQKTCLLFLIFYSHYNFCIIHWKTLIVEGDVSEHSICILLIYWSRIHKPLRSYIELPLYFFEGGKSKNP